MKKLLGVFTFATILFLAACNNSGAGSQIVSCVHESEGSTVTAEVTAEDGYVTSSLVTMKVHHSAFDFESVDELNDEDSLMILEMVLGAGVEIDGDYIVVEYANDFDDETNPLDEFVANLESEGATCN